MKIVLWCLLACAGMAVMIAAYRFDRPRPEAVPLASGLIFISKTGSAAPVKPSPFPATQARVRKLPLGEFASLVVGRISQADASRGAADGVSAFRKCLRTVAGRGGITETALAWGRLPQAGQKEAVAGFRTRERQKIQVGGQTFSIVGGLVRDVALLAGCYLVPRDQASGQYFVPSDPSVRTAFLIPLSQSELDDKDARERLDQSFPEQKFDSRASIVYTQRGQYLSYLFGEALWCLGGSGVLIGLYRAAASRVRRPVLRDPLVALSRHSRLLWGVHLAYFGIYLLAALSIYYAPDVQDTLLAILQKEIRGGTGPLAVAGKAYATKNIALAALATFGINFFLGSVICLTIPSCVIPASGTVVALFRALLWGVVLGPHSAHPCPNDASTFRNIASGRGGLHPGDLLRLACATLLFSHRSRSQHRRPLVAKRAHQSQREPDRCHSPCRRCNL